MGGVARRLAVVLRSGLAAAVTATAVLVLAWALAPLVRLVFGHVTTLRVVAVAALAAAGCLAVRLLRGPGTAAGGAGRADAALARLPTDVALGVIVGCAWGAWLALARASRLPSVFGDELVYSGLGKGIARGEGLSLAGVPTRGYGVLYPAAISPFYRLTADGVAAFAWIKALNTVAMVLAAVVAYFVARRVVGRNWALAVAALSVAVPAMAYARLVMTEPLAYTAFLLLALGLLRALETPTVARQLMCVALLAVAIGVRLQAVALAPAIVVAVLAYAISAGETRAVLRRFTPTWLALAVGVVLALAVTGGHPEDALGSYSVLARSYSVAGLVKWLVWTATSLELAAAIVPVFALCVTAPLLLRRAARPGERALGAVAISWTIWLVTSTTALSASQYGLDRLHERNLFYVLPLLFVCLAYWIEQQRPWPRRLAVSSLLVLAALPLLLPNRLVHTDSVFDAPSMFPWANIDRQLGPLPVQAFIAVVVVAAVLWSSFSRLAVVPVVVVGLVFYTVVSEAAYRERAVPVVERSAWVDEALRGASRATLLHVDIPSACRTVSQPRANVRLTEFFNAAIDRVFHLFADSTARGIGSPPVHVGADGLITSDGRPLRPRYVVTQAPVRLVGTRLPSPAAKESGLTLWEVAPPLRLADPWAVGAGTCPLAALRSVQSR